MIRVWQRKLLFVVCGASVAIPGFAADWSYAPKASLTTEYVNNPRLAPSGDPLYISSTGDATADVSTDIGHHGEQFDLSIDPRALYTGVLDHSILNQNDQFLDVKSSYKTELTTWSGTADLVRDTTLTSELGLTGLSDTDKRREGLSVSAGPTSQITERWSIGATGAYQANHYVDSLNTGLLDYRYSAADLNTSYALTETLQGALDVSAGRLGVERPASATDNYAANLSFTNRVTELWTLGASGGASRTISSISSSNGALYAFTAQHTGELLTLNAKISKDITPTGAGGLTRRELVQLNAARAWTERFNVDVAASVIRNRTLSDIGTDQVNQQVVTYNSFSSNWNYRLTPNWTASLDLRRDQQDIDDPASHAHSYHAGLSIVWNGVPHGFH